MMMCACMHVRMHVCLHVRTYVCMYARTHARMCTHARMYACTHVRMYVCVHVRTNLYTCKTERTHTHTHTFTWEAQPAHAECEYMQASCHGRSTPKLQGPHKRGPTEHKANNKRGPHKANNKRGQHMQPWQPTMAYKPQRLDTETSSKRDYTFTTKITRQCVHQQQQEQYKSKKREANTICSNRKHTDSNKARLTATQHRTKEGNKLQCLQLRDNGITT